MAEATAEEAAEIARRYNEEQLENLASVNAANQKIIEYKLQGANLTLQERHDVEIFLTGLSSVTDEQTKQNLLLEFAAAMREKGIEINLQDYQTLLLKQDLTYQEIEALQEKRALGEEAFRYMKEDLDIQRHSRTHVRRARDLPHRFRQYLPRPLRTRLPCRLVLCHKNYLTFKGWPVYFQAKGFAF